MPKDLLNFSNLKQLLCFTVISLFMINLLAQQLIVNYAIVALATDYSNGNPLTWILHLITESAAIKMKMVKIEDNKRRYNQCCKKF